MLANKHQQCLELMKTLPSPSVGEVGFQSCLGSCLNLRSRIEVEEPINLLLDNCLIGLGDFQRHPSVEKFLALESRYNEVRSLLVTLSRDIDDDMCVAYGGGDFRCEISVWKCSSVDYVLDEVEAVNSTLSVRVRLLKNVALSDHSGTTLLESKVGKVNSAEIDRDDFDSGNIGFAFIELRDFQFTTFRLHQPRALPRTDCAKDGVVITPQGEFAGETARLGFKFRLDETKNNDNPLVCIDIYGD